MIFSLTNMQEKRMYSFTIFIASLIACDALKCQTLEPISEPRVTHLVPNEIPLTGVHLWQHDHQLACFMDFPTKTDWLNVTCRIGTNTTKDVFHIITFDALKNNNSIFCEFKLENLRDTWELNDIDMDPKNELTFVEGDENHSIELFVGFFQSFRLFNEKTTLFRLYYPLNHFFSHAEKETDNFLFSKFIQIGLSRWIVLFFTKITLNHAGPWKTELGFFNQRTWLESKLKTKNSTVYINVLSNFTCVSNNSASCFAREFSPIVEIKCSASRISQFQWKENIVCRIDNETLNSTSSSESKFLVDSSRHEGKRVVCFSGNTNQTWESSPIEYFHQETINTTEAISVDNSNKRDCTYSWMTPKIEIVGNVLDWFRMKLYGYGKYQGIISCPGSCPYINYVVNFVNRPDPSTKLTTTTTPSLSTIFNSTN